VAADDEDQLAKFLKYDGMYNLAVCIECGYGLPLEWIGKHFKDIHSLAVPSGITLSNKNSFPRPRLNGLMNGLWTMKSRHWRSVELGKRICLC
jgi:hypothetical protein